jgi:hypothetical protein
VNNFFGYCVFIRVEYYLYFPLLVGLVPLVLGLTFTTIYIYILASAVQKKIIIRRQTNEVIRNLALVATSFFIIIIVFFFEQVIIIDINIGKF